MRSRHMIVVSMAALAAGLMRFGQTPVGAAVPAVPAEGADRSSVSATVERARARAHAGSVLERLPISFIENRGQLDGRVAYYVPRSGMDTYFAAEGVTYALTRSSMAESAHDPTLAGGTAAESRKRKPTERWAVKLEFVNADHARGPTGRGQTPSIISYFKGPRSEWKTQVPAYAEVAYPDLWPGIDLVYAGNGGRLKYTFTSGRERTRSRSAWRIGVRPKFV